MPAVRLRRIWVRVVAMAAAGLLVAMAAAPVSAAPASGRVSSTGPHVRKVSPSTAGTRPARVTLITGDTVTYSTDQAGHVAVTVDTGPGRSVVRYRATTENGRYYMIPSDAEALVSAGVLDKELFDLNYLVDNGYGDAKTPRLPVIVQYRQRMAAATVRQKADALPASTAPLALGAINGAAVRVDKHQAGAFWKAIVGGGATAAPGAALGRVASRLGAGLGKVWLDARVKASDDVSNAQIGAPVAWAAGFDGSGIDVGVIDTGIDANHPDLAGKVDAAQNFVPAGEPGGGDQTDVTDRFGHGTHVASIIAGTGAASDGRYKGVAPRAKLIIAKGLSDAGSGSDSTIIAAMQWEAATQHARIVSMSLGGGPTDGTDPLSQAVNDLTAQYGTLFVIAAGNSGPDARTVAAPGAATAALTVGAVDSADKLAFFSSRGPRSGDEDFVVKPEITAPGWNIIAARAAGTSLGEDSSIPGGGPIDDFYTAASGTSMATPHVAGAAAALVQQHPDWTSEQLKTVLVGTAHDIGDTVYEQGAGRLDLGRAITQQVFADTASISGGFTLPATGQLLTRQVTYRNTGTNPVTLNLTTRLLRDGTDPAGPAVVTVSPSPLTVPAGGTASAQVTIDPSAVAGSGLYTGRLQATDTTGDELTVPIGFRVHPPMRTLRVRIDASSQPVRFTSPVNFFTDAVSTVRVNDDDPALAAEPLTEVTREWSQTDQPGVIESALRLPQGGVYSVYTTASFRDSTDAHWHYWTLVRPQVRLDQDTTVTFDLKDTVPVDVNTDQPSDLTFLNTGDERITANGVGVYDFTIFSYPGVAPADFWMTPTQPPTIGSYQAWFNQTRPASQVTAALSGTRRIDLHPRYMSDLNVTPKFTADRHLQLVSEAELRAGREVRGRLVVADPEPDHQVPAGHPELIRLVSTIELAHRGGAAGVITDSFYAWYITASWFPLPVLWVDKAQGAQVRAALAQAVRPLLDIHADLSTPYQYKLVKYLRGRIPDTLAFDPKVSELTRIQTTFHAQYQHAPLQWGPAPDVNEADATFAPGQNLQILGSHAFVGGTSRVDYYNPTGPDILWSRSYEFDDRNTDSARLALSQRAFTHPTSEREDWNGAILPAQITPGPNLPMNFGIGFVCDGCRQGDRLRVRPTGALGIGFSDASDSSLEFQELGTEETHLFQGGTELQPQSDEFGLPYYTLPAGTGSYRFTDLFTDGFAGPHSATRVATTWTFQSSHPDIDNVSGPYLCLDSVISGDTDPCAWQPLIYLHYRLGLTAQDAAPAGRSHAFTITAQQGDPSTAATLASLQVWISPDGGKHWTKGYVTPKPDRTYQVVVLNPTLAASPTGTVALRAEARDAAGNSVQQTIMDAYVLK